MATAYLVTNKLIVDGVDFSRFTMAVSLELKPGHAPSVEIAIAALSVEIDKDGNIIVQTMAPSKVPSPSPPPPPRETRDV